MSATEQNEEVLKMVDETLEAAYAVLSELELEMARIENPNIKTNSSKRKIRNRMRLINNFIYTGEKAKENLQADKQKVLRKRKNNC